MTEKHGFFGARVLDLSKDEKNSSLVIEGGNIVYVGPKDDCPEECQPENWTDLSGKWIVPGFVNGHTHVAMCFMRELTHDSSNMIEEIFFPLESQLTEENVYTLSFSGIAAGLKSGVTSFVDHFYHEKGIERAFRECGVRAFLAETLADLGGAQPKRCPPETFVEARNWNESSEDLIRYHLGPHAMDTTSAEFLSEMAEFSKSHEIPLHMHLSQTKKERQHCMEKFGKSPVQLAADCGALNERSLLVHLVSADQKDLDLIQKSRARVGLCPGSQLIYEELAPLDEIFQRSLPAVLGSDCAASHDSMDIMHEMRTLYLASRAKGYRVTAREVLACVWDEAAKWLGSRIGALKIGYKADFVVLNPGLESEPCHDPYLHLVMTLSSRHVQDVYVDGRAVLKDQELLSIDEEEKRSMISTLMSSFKLS